MPLATARRGQKRPGVWKQSWAQTRRQRIADLPAGPSTLREVVQWEDHVMAAFSADQRARLLSHAAAGLDFNTLFSGMDCAREALERGWAKLAEAASPGQLRFTASCDIGRLQTKVATLRNQQLPQTERSCHFGNFLDRLHPAAHEHLAGLAPTSTMTVAQCKGNFEKMRCWLKLNRKWVFSKDATAFCHVHQRQCPVYPQSSAFSSSPSPCRMSSSGVQCVGCWRSDAHFLCFPAKSERSKRSQT